jgi:hypothetical protein
MDMVAYLGPFYSFENIIYIDFQIAKEYFENNNIDLAICDHFSDACYSAAKLLDIPYIITVAIPITKGKFNKMLSLNLT